MDENRAENEPENEIENELENKTAQTFSESYELSKQAGATGIQLDSHLKFLNLKRFDEERNILVWISACYEVKKGNISISGLNAFFE